MIRKLNGSNHIFIAKENKGNDIPVDTKLFLFIIIFIIKITK